MARSLINWALLAELVMPAAVRRIEMWDAFATNYDGYVALSSSFVAAQINYLQIRPDETVLDIGAGPGRIAIPAAKQARSVTALDFSPSMLAVLRQHADLAGVKNIRTLCLDWNDVHPGGNLEQHDVVIAARSPAMSDVVRINSLARRAAFIITYCNAGLKFFHDTLMAGIETESDRTRVKESGLPLGFIAAFNLLAEMGIEAHVDYVDDGFSKWYPDEDTAVADFAWLKVLPDSLARFRENLRTWLRQEKEGIRLDMKTRTAILWWEKNR